MKNLFFENSNFHNPKLVLIDDEKAKKVENVLSKFVLSKSNLFKVKDIFTEEMKLGFEKDSSKRSSLLMMNTYITENLDGNEQGEFLSIDLGSTNFRVCYLKLDCLNQKDEFFVKYYDIQNKFKFGTQKELFGYLANCIKDFITNQVKVTTTKIFPLGFTFSFPINQKSINSGLLISWTKSFNIQETINNDPAEILQKELDNLNLNIKIVVLINDTVGTLIKGIYLNQKCKIGCILGTGFNISYLESRLQRISKWSEERSIKYPHVKQTIIDIESGAFGDNGKIDFIKTDIDFYVDNNSLFSNSFSFEKLFSGKFLCNIFQLILKNLVERELLLNGELSENLNTFDFVNTEHITLIEKDQTKETLIVFLNLLGYDNFIEDDLLIIRYICEILSVRCAALVSCTFASVIEWIDEDDILIAIDGSLFKHHPKLNKLLKDFTSELINHKRKFDIFLVFDGSGKGATIAASIATKNDTSFKF